MKQIAADEYGQISCIACGDVLGDMTDMEDAERDHDCTCCSACGWGLNARGECPHCDGAPRDRSDYDR